MAIVAACCGSTTASAATAAPHNRVIVTAETRKAAFREAVQMWQGGRADLIGDLVANGYVGHVSSGDRDVRGLRERVSEFHALYPDLKFTIEDQLADGDRIVTRMTATGTSKATGKVVHLIGLNISRFVGNSIAEEWPVWEVLQAK
jgi:predicted ester cyclase